MFAKVFARSQSGPRQSADAIEIILDVESMEKTMVMHQGIAAAKKLIDDGRRGYTVAALADRCDLSVGRFCHLFKQQIGVSVWQYANMQRFAEAARLLEHTALTVKEIAFRVGYLDTSHFSRSFKQRFGLSPCAFSARSKIGHEKPLASRAKQTNYCSLNEEVL